MNITNLSPFQLTLGVIVILLSSWFWIYIASRLMSAGVIRSWMEFMAKKKPPKGKQEEEER